MKNLVYIFLLLSFTALSQESKLEDLYQTVRKFYSLRDLDSAEILNKRLDEMARDAGSVKYTARSSFYSGRISAEKLKQKEAFDYYFEALRQSRQARDQDLELTILEDIGSLFSDQKNFSSAKKYFLEVAGIKTIRGDSIKLANTLMNISMLCRRSKEEDSAQLILDRVRRIAFSQNDSMLLANYFNSQAGLYFYIFMDVNQINKYGNDPNLWDRDFKLKNYRDSAQMYWTEAFAIWQRKAKAELSLQPLFNLALVAQTRKDRKGAIEKYVQALKITDSLGATLKKITIYGNMAELYADDENFKESANYFRKLLELKDSLQLAESKAYALKLDKLYQLETKNKTILQQELKINKQEKQIYFYILLFIILLFIGIAIFFYASFNKRVAKRIEQAKEKFFSNIMHEIRTPLSMIQAPLKTLRPKINDEESLYYIQLAEKNVNRLNELISQMLDISKIENSVYQLNPTVGNLDYVFRDLLANYEKLAIEKNIHFVSELNYENVLLQFDKDALEKIIGNLLSNAIKYTPENGTVGLSIQLEEAENNCKLLVEVWDTGIGIPKADQDKIFTRFFRAGKSANKIQGLGIGLSLVKDLVSAYKGEITFQSEPDKGTKFAVEIPLISADGSFTEQQQINPDSGKPVVLIVEDDEDILNFNASFLKGKDLQVVKAANALMARTLLKNISPDLIVTDLMMDGLDGLSFIKEIKSNKGLNHIPIIVLSAKSAGQTRVEVLNAGAQAFLSKPFLPEELFSIINNQLGIIAKIKKELQLNIQKPSEELPAEKKFSSSEPYTQKLFDLIFKQLDNSELSVEMLADLMATNRSHFQRKIKSLTGYSPSELIKLVRLEKAREFLLARKGNITEVAYMCGFSSQSYFTKCYTQHFGHSPTQALHQPAS